jgi:amino acid adenylation domain-containing protein
MVDDLEPRPALAGLSPAQLDLVRQLLEEQAIELPAAAGIPRRHERGQAPLSFAQQGLWFLHQLDPHSAAYNIPVRLLFAGPLRRDVLERAIGEVAARHEVLRTSFRQEHGEALQVISPAVRVALPMVDLGGLDGAAAAAEARRLALAEALRPFDLRRPPLLRTALLRLGADRHVLQATMHHIISDAWSGGLLVGEVAAAYQALAAGRRPLLPELAIQFGDFAAWQRQRQSSADLDRQLAFWQQRLRGLPRLELAADRPRPASRSSRGAVLRFAMAMEMTARLRAQATQQDASLFMVLLAGFAALLGRYSNQEDFAVGTPIANRTQAETEPLIGYFVNTLALRVDLAGAPGLLQLVERVRDMTLAAYENEEVPFERVVEALRPQRDLAFTPLFQVVLALHAAGRQAAATLPGLHVTGFDAEDRTAKFDLNLNLTDGGRELAGTLEYSTDLFDRTTMTRLLDHWQRLLEAAAAAPQRRIHELPLLTPGEAHQIQLEWNDAGPCGSPGALAHTLLEQWARRQPEAPAVAAEDGLSLTYGALDARADRLAGALRRRGIGPEAVVGLCLERSPEMVVAIVATLKAGGAYLPLDPDLPPQRLAHMLDDSGARVVVTQRSLRRILPATAAAVIELDGDAFAAETGGRGRGAGDRSGAAGVPRLANAAYVIYTSGSTGLPKGVVVTHGNLSRLLSATARWFAFGPRDVWTLCHSYAFDFSVWELWGALAFGGRLVVVSDATRKSPPDLRSLLARQGVTVLNQTPSAFRRLIESDAAPPACPESLRLVIFGGEALEPGSLRRWFDRHGDRRPLLVNMYGITETTVHVTYRPLRQEDADGASRSLLGRNIPDLRVHLLAASGEPVPLGVPAELCVGGAGLARGYLRRPELTAARFVPDPFASLPGERLYRSGDLARRLPDGDVEYLGRMDHQVKVRGFRIELGEIEAVLGSHPGVREAVVAARARAGHERLVAYVAPREVDGAAPPKAAALREYLRQRLPEYMVPAVFVQLAALPLTPQGKVDRRALPEPEARRPELEESYVAPRSQDEEVLAGIWSQVLGLDRVGVRDGFFALGGDSISSLQVLALARERGLFFTLQDLFRFQTIAELAAVAKLDGAPAAAAPSTPFSMIREEDRRQLSGDVVDAYPLAWLQAGMLFQMELHADHPPYHNVDSWRLRGRFELAPFQEAVRRVVDRHPVLRTAFALAGYSEPLQLVHAAAELPVGFDDLRAFPAEEQEAHVQAYCRAEKRRLLDFSRAPQLRLHVDLLDGETYQLTLTENHAILDGWSLHATLAEVFGLYLRLRQGEDPPIEPPPRAAYRDFIQLERGALAADDSETFWLGKVRDLPRLDLLSWHAAEPGRHGRASVSAMLPAPTAEGLMRLAQRLAVPIKSVLLAAHLQVLSLLAGRTEVVTGFVVNGRPAERDGEQVRGLFLNSVPLRLDVGGASWADLVRGAFAAEREALPHRRYPMGEMQRRAGGGPLFEVMFNYVHFRVIDDVLRSQEVEVVGGTMLEGTEMPLEVTFTRHSVRDGAAAPLLGLDMGCARGLFPQARIDAFGGLYLRVLASIAAAPDERPSALDLWTASERHQVLVEWNDTHLDLGEPRCLHRWFEMRASAIPDAAALFFADEIWSYGGLNRSANRLAHRLVALGIGGEDRVALCLERSPEMIVAILAVLKAGAAYLPLDPQHPRERLAYMLADANAALVLVQTPLLPLLPPPPCDRPVLCLDRGLQLAAGESDGDPHPRGWPDGLAYVMYTSGSTGRPKGVMVPHRGVANRLRWSWIGYPLTLSDRVLMKTSIGFDVSVWECLGTLIAGAQLVMAKPGGQRDGAYLVGLIRERQVTMVHFVPSMLQELLHGEGLARCDSLSCVFAGGEAVLPEVCAAFLGQGLRAPLRNQYGPTEASIDVTDWTCHPEDLARPRIPLGRPIGNVTIFVLDAQLQPALPGVPGELHLGGAALARGYLDQPDLTAARFIPDALSGLHGARLYKTGDLARIQPDGVIDFLGRIDLQVKVRGFRIETGEIESVLMEHPAVAKAAVVLRQDTAVGATLAAYLVPRGDAATPAAELFALLRSRLPEYMVPASITCLTELPLTANGKLNRRALPSPLPLSEAQRPFVAPRSDSEAAIAAIWSTLLGRHAVSVHDDFFQLGGHSLLAARGAAMVRAAFAVSLPLADLFEHPTVERLAAAVDRLRSAAAAPPDAAIRARSIDSAGRRTAAAAMELPMSFAQQRLWFLDQLNPGSAAYNIFNSFRLVGRLDPNALRHGLAQLGRRHETLRTSFHAAGGQGAQVIHTAPVSPLSVVDLRGLSEPARRACLRRLAAAAWERPFDLSRQPLWRIELARLDDEEWGVLVAMHHIISDGLSLEILVREVAEVYNARFAGAAPALGALPVQYADFAVWQRGWLASGPLAEQLAQWQARLAGAPPLLELRGALPRPPVQGARGGVAEIELSPALGAALQAASRTEKCSLFAWLLAAELVLLGHLGNRTDVVVGLPVAGRDRAELEGVIGFFVNLLPLRADLTGDPTFREHLQRVRVRLVEAYGRQDTPFELLVDRLQAPRGLGFNPLVQVTCDLRHAAPAAGEAVRFAGLAVRPLDLADDPDAPLESAHFDLSFQGSASGSEIGISLIYNRDLFEAATARAYLAALEALLARVAEQPAARLQELDALLAASLRDSDARLRRTLEETRRDKFKTLKPRSGHRPHAAPAGSAGGGGAGGDRPT